MDRIGVSPAFVVSAYGPGFGAREYLAAAPRVASLGFRALELEQYASGATAEWNASSCARLSRLMDDEGLEPSQFVAHFCLGDFGSRAALERAACLEEFPRVVDACARFPRCGVVTIPLPAYLIASHAELAPAAVADARGLLIELVAKYFAVASSAGKRLAL
ncbi:MAG: TIM barrel protein, partial [Spirochaetaceae bacterium]|nr:TIM barrel protein [Spirochaetaceae bacterium]